jgi:DNA-binding transcriptional LysR family regulator
VARDLLQGWDDGVAVVADAAAQEARVLRVGTLTSIGRALYPAIIDHFAKRQPGWQVELRSFGWGDATGGLRDQAADAAFVWLPVDDPLIESEVLAVERGGLAPRIAAEVSSADEVFEIVASGAAITLLAEGNAAIYARPGIVCLPVRNLEPARLAVAWRRGDRRPAVRNFVRACRDAAGT